MLDADDLPPPSPKDAEVQVKSTFKAYLYCIVMSIGPIYHGYSLTLIAASSMKQLINYYDIPPLQQQTITSLLNGILPFGGMIGCLILPYVMPSTNKKQIHYGMLLITVIACGLSIIHSFEAIMISRFIIGILNAFHVSVANGYVKETFPISLRNPFGAIHSCGRVLGILVCFTIAEIFDYREDNVQHISVFFGLVYIAFLQAALIFFFLPHSPVQMVKTNNERQLLASLEILYWNEDISKAMMQIKKRVQNTLRGAADFPGLNLMNSKNLLSFHLALLRQWCGSTFIIVYARQVMNQMGSDLADQTPVIVNSVQLAAGIVGVFLVRKLQKTKMAVVATISLAVIIFIIGIMDLFDFSIPCLIFMTIFMVPFGAGLASAIWSYPSQLASPKKGKYAALTTWTGIFTVSVIPPLVTNAMPDKSAYPVFFFFGVYLILAAFINSKVLVVVQGPKNQVIQLKMREKLVQ